MLPPKHGKKYQPVGVGMAPSKTEFGKFIRDRRLELDLRQIPVSKAAGLGPSNNVLSLLEVGKRKHLNPKQIEGLAKVLQIDPEELRKRMPEKHVAKPRTELGKLIQARREELGMSLAQFAKKSGLTLRQAKHLEIRKNQTLRYPLAEPLAKALKLEIATFAKFVGREGKVTGSELGQLVRQRRKELVMSLAVLAEKLSVSRQFVDQIESGQCRLSTNDEMIEKLAGILKLDVSQLNAIRPRRRLKAMATPATPLSGFLTGRRLELRLTQREVSDRAETGAATISGVETGRVQPTPDLLDKLAKALECEIPLEIIPHPRERKLRDGRREPGFTLERVDPLGEFVTTRRLELRLTQREVSDRAETGAATISGVETGRVQPTPDLLDKLAKALECEIPADLIPERKAGGRSSSISVVHLSGHAAEDLDKIRKLAAVKGNHEIVRKAVQLLRRLLEKQEDGYVVFVVKGKKWVELEILL